MKTVKCKSDIFDENLDGANVAAAYNEYRRIDNET